MPSSCPKSRIASFLTCYYKPSDKKKKKSTNQKVHDQKNAPPSLYFEGSDFRTTEDRINQRGIKRQN